MSKETPLTPLQVAIAERKASINAIITARKEELAIKYINSDTFLIREMLENDINTINALLSMAKDSYVLDGRKLSATFGYGTIPNLLITLAKAILYAKAHEKEELLIVANTTIDTVEALVEALGQEAYFNPKTGTIREEIPMDIGTVTAMLRQLISDLNLVSEVSLAKFNETTIGSMFTRAQLKAKLAYENYINYIEGIEDTVYLD
jgi:hypothetical protein